MKSLLEEAALLTEGQKDQVTIQISYDDAKMLKKLKTDLKNELEEFIDSFLENFADEYNLDPYDDDVAFPYLEVK